MSAKPELRVDWASADAVKYACTNWHYSRSVPVPPLVKIGAWEDGKFIGVVVFSRGASSNLLSPYGLNQDEGCELTRIALTKHRSAVSRIVRLSLLFLKKHSSGLRLVVSFADPHQGHHGGVYQAGNWIYIGDTAPGQEYWNNGKRLHSRQVSEKGWNVQQGQVRKTVKPSECTIIKTPGKHRYIMPLDAEMKAKILPLSKPYPRRHASASSETVERPSTVDGAAPIRTLNDSTARVS
jgi:hypothetical protein